jgi:predicted DNA-binding transcriptional regulator AlpA
MGGLREAPPRMLVAMESLKTEVVVLSRAELTDLVEQAVQRALDQYVASQPAPERLLKSSEMAARLGISESQLSVLCGEGLPHVLIGDRVRRFEAEAVLAWLRGRGL